MLVDLLVLVLVLVLVSELQTRPVGRPTPPSTFGPSRSGARVQSAEQVASCTTTTDIGHEHEHEQDNEHVGAYDHAYVDVDACETPRVPFPLGFRAECNTFHFRQTALAN